ncbi:ATP-binding cassette domain-containing protein [Paenibacillus sp. HB172176]|uniref:ABC transporter ATP-binding protein n=1 Tax=Paenibacillus sp. HB172176 TaxID=2493690 RepID=UPI001439289E|nr:ATP-binding cassette domain-containing protein [Paenibacillus sp. HB172176]
MYLLKDVKYKNILQIENLQIPAQQMTCIVGESGSGKSTLLKLLNHLISSDEGEVWYENKPLSKWDPVALRRKVVMLSQTPAIFPGTVRDNLLIGLQFSEKPHAEDAALRKVLDRVRLDKELSQEADSLSGGEKQRLALARVLLMEPEVILLDEPSSALDEATTEFVMGQLAEQVRQLQRTLIMVTHSKVLVQTYADHVIEIEKGKLISGMEDEYEREH